MNVIPIEQKELDPHFIAEHYVPNIIPNNTITTENPPSIEDSNALADPGIIGAIFSFDTAAVLWIIEVSSLLL
ncbi:hypothetical protein D0S48_08915 [Psychrobacillus sp. AK 1817]|nr:hypothetical protein D0S48_08915 [Psychrobacillus sp. AK 1817]